MKPSELLVFAFLLLGALGVLYVLQSSELTGAVFSDHNIASNDKTFDKKFKYVWDAKKDDAGGVFDGKRHIPVAQGASLGKSFEIEVQAILNADSSGMLVSQVDYLHGIRIELSVTREGKIRFFIGDADNSFVIQTTNSFNDGNEHFIRASLNQDVAVLNVDNVDQQVDAPLSNLDSGVDITIGANAGYLQWMQITHQNFKGTIKHVSVRAPKHEI